MSSGRSTKLEGRDELLQLLQALLPAQFEEVLYRARIPTEFLSATNQTQRAIDLLRYVQGRGETDRLIAILSDPRFAGSAAASVLRQPERDGNLVVAGALISPAAGARPDSTTPVQAYLDARIKALSERLDEARARKAVLRDAGMSSDEVEREILELRRQLRDGGQLRAGDSLGDGRYLLVKDVGRGGFAVVWEAYDRKAQLRVAIKVLHAHLAGDPQRRERFFRGARVMMRLAHSAVVRVLDPRGQDDAFCYFVMELVPGGNLREAVLARRVPAPRVVSLILQVGDALAEAHRQNLVHRDVKPSNILLDEHGNAKLTDFDLVGGQDTTGGTRTGALGTVVYAAPECLDRPHEATVRADVFGLGMTAIFCLAGQDLSLVTFRNPEATIAGLDCTERVRRVLARAVAWEPGDRFADAAAMVDALRGALDTSSQNPAADDTTAKVPVAPSRYDAGRGAITPSQDGTAPVEAAPPSRYVPRQLEVNDPVHVRREQAASAGELHEQISKLLAETDVYVKHGMDQKAVDHLRRVLGLDPDNVEAHERLKNIFILQGRKQEATAELRKLAEVVARTDPDRAEVYLQEGLRAAGLAGAAVLRAASADDEASTVHPPVAEPERPPPGVSPWFQRALRPARRWWPALAGIALVGLGVAGYVVVAARAPQQVGPPAASAVGPLTEDAPRAAVPVPVPTEGAPSAMTPTPSASPCPDSMVRVPGGTFKMGSPAGTGDDDERPQHAVTLSGYCIDRTEVTVAAYAACVQAGRCAAATRTVQWSMYTADDVKRWSRYCNGEDRPEHPMNCVDWVQSSTYCSWAGRRLPTEAEWEYAARGSEERTYPWGGEPPTEKRLNACGSECVAMLKRDLSVDWKAMYNGNDGWETTAPVGSFPAGASSFGAQDMAGNVAEWTADWYGPYAASAVTNPTGPKESTTRVIRGGGWGSDGAAWVRGAYRFRYEPTNRDNYVGFRCARGD